jgi:hypothetical protein
MMSRCRREQPHPLHRRGQGNTGGHATRPVGRDAAKVGWATVHPTNDD